MKYLIGLVLAVVVIGGGWYLLRSGSPLVVPPMSNVPAVSNTTEPSTTTTMGSCEIVRDLVWGAKGQDVSCLQSALIAKGYSIPAGATGYFGPQTELAVSAWQSHSGVMPANGYFGTHSRAAFGSAATSTATPGVTSYALADVATHPDRTSCWSAINGNVYDLTSWIDKHPGGADRILSICGKDGSSAFTKKHLGEPRPEAMLATFKVGVLK